MRMHNFPDQKLKSFDFVEVYNEKKKNNEIAALLHFKQVLIVASL
jgi:hypothetical protein